MHPSYQPRRFLHEPRMKGVVYRSNGDVAYHRGEGAKEGGKKVGEKVGENSHLVPSLKDYGLISGRCGVTALLRHL